ncbi:DUF4136 domain-containing protein [Qipengyuania marisflavi]|uniref:DUF4136 domain-containing protein n=1 Tax=Qipengyuania marisflavi TaxID=2486356 RepID=A0A5S3NZA5_9SPHN|nr:DUF4136 domain-containing protein [Qipengyuania marisflavi]TMM45860.1 DUF4136 domain-containing protein [Qipengyuania marisflavi]
MTILTQDWGRKLKLASVPLLIAGLAACATPFNADVSRYQTQLPAPQGESFFVVADDPSLSGGLEFSQYADLVEAQMARLGYAEAPSAEAATMLVRFDYGVDNGRERVRSTGFHDPFYSPWYGYSPYRGSRFGSRFGYGRRTSFYRPRSFGSRWGYGFYDPWFGGSQIDSYTVYTSGVDLKIDRAADGQRLFEGKAQAMSTSPRLPYLVPNLVEAMFTDFPGNSGETLRISIAPEKTTVRRVD